MIEKQRNFIYKMSPVQFAPWVGLIGPAGEIPILVMLLWLFIKNVCLLQAMLFKIKHLSKYLTHFYLHRRYATIVMSKLLEDGQQFHPLCSPITTLVMLNSVNISAYIYFNNFKLIRTFLRYVIDFVNSNN